MYFKKACRVLDACCLHKVNYVGHGWGFLLDFSLELLQFQYPPTIRIQYIYMQSGAGHTKKIDLEGPWLKVEELVPCGSPWKGTVT